MTKKAQLEAEMEQVPGTDYGRLGELQGQIDQLDEEILSKMDRWDELSQYVD